MAEPNSMKVLEVCRVAPQSSSAETLEFLSDLTFFDLFWLRFPPVQRIFFYETSTSSDSIVSKLKASLSTTLQHFLPIAGALTWPQDSHKPILQYRKGDAVSVTIAESDADFSRLISTSNEFVEAKKYHPLVPQLDVSHERASVMAFQITIFPNRGFSIGMSTHHAALDGKSSTMFLKSWAHICKHGDITSTLKPFLGKMVVNDAAGLDSVLANQFLNMNGPNNRSLMCSAFQSPVQPDSIRGTFYLTTAKIEALREFATRKMVEKQHDLQSVHMSLFSITCAYTWVCLVKAEEIKSDKVVMILGVDCRPRLDPPLPANYFGNCLIGQVVVAEREGVLGEDGFVVAVKAISDAIKGLQKGVLLNGLVNMVSNMYGDGKGNNEGRVFPIAGSPRFKMYDTDFGWGRPRKIDIISIERAGAISLSDSRNGDGSVEIGLVLRKPNMDAFASLFAKGLDLL